MLPIVKEIVEILFADGLIKVVFATTTFAIGLNMPARSVLFTEVFKFDGEDKNLLSTSEYLQMAGRAGRRGKDPTGSCILNLDRSFGKLPIIQELERLLENKGMPLESKLKLSYAMTLNVMKSDDIGIKDLLKSSFFENENEKERSTATLKVN
jgi:superfamily II RNA helicase